MDNNYPYWANPVVLTDTIFSLYGGHSDNTVSAQRQAAFVIAEEALSRDLGTYLVNTRVTGSYQYSGERVELDHAYINNIVLVRFKEFNENIYYTVSGTSNWYINIRDDDRGIMEINALYFHYCPPHYGYVPYTVEVVYETGLTSGTTYTPNILLSLTTYADIILNEIIGFGNEGPGDVGVTQFSNQQYSETRMKFFNTAYGNSARAQFVHGLLKRWRRYRRVGI